MAWGRLNVFCFLLQTFINAERNCIEKDTRGGGESAKTAFMKASGDVIYGDVLSSQHLIILK